MHKSASPAGIVKKETTGCGNWRALKARMFQCVLETNITSTMQKSSGYIYEATVAFFTDMSDQIISASQGLHLLDQFRLRNFLTDLSIP
jgi:hypothetical protein